MGGFGSGGSRVGAGRKSKRTDERKVAGSRARTKASDADAPADGEAIQVDKPDGMTPQQSRAWDELAPWAAKAGTLVPATVSAFRDLCEVVAMRRQIMAQLERDGLMVNVVKIDEDSGERFSVGAPMAHPLVTHERQYRLREEAGKARFAIAPAGKAMPKDSEEVKDPFAEFMSGPRLAVSNQ